jgi:hypothetical protein
MAEVKPIQKVLPFAGLIFIEGFLVDPVLQRIAGSLGKVILRSEAIPFDLTTYYNKEMGAKLFRQWCVFENLVMPDVLAGLKIKTNEIEKDYLNERKGRRINIDPGLLSLSNIILASTKNYSHRIYLGQGIYAEVTLIFKGREFRALEWTYPDYREQATQGFFTKGREILKNKLLEEPGCMN